MILPIAAGRGKSRNRIAQPMAAEVPTPPLQCPCGGSFTPDFARVTADVPAKAVYRG